MDWLAGFGWSGLITVAVSMVWVIFPLNNKLLVCIYISSFIAWSVLEYLSGRTRNFRHNFVRSFFVSAGTQMHSMGYLDFSGSPAQHRKRPDLATGASQKAVTTDQ